MIETCLLVRTKRKNNINYKLQHKERHKNTIEAYTDGSKTIGRKVGFAAIFTDITRREALPEEVSIHTAEMKVIKVA